MRDWRQFVREHLPPLGLSGARETEIVEELAQQLEQSCAEAIARGASRVDAEERAAGQFRDWTVLAAEIRRAETPVVQHAVMQAATHAAARLPEPWRAALREEQFRKHRGGNMLADLLQDLRYALRMLGKAPGFTALVVLTLALGIGGNTAIFSLVDDALLKPLPYHDSDGIVLVWENTAGKAKSENIVSAPNYLDWEKQSDVFERMAIYEYLGYNLSGEAEPEVVEGLRASRGLFDVLGVKPMMGRTFFPEEETAGREHVVVLSYGLWKTRYAADQSILGKTIRINQESYTVVGVMPQGFTFPTSRQKLWVPMVFNQEDHHRGSHSFFVCARLKPGVDMEQARTEMNTIGLRLAQEYPEDNRGESATVTRMRDLWMEDFQQVMWTLLLAVGFVLLIACVNIANLLLARGSSRRKEIAVRAALGASRGRIFRQLMTESILLALAGGVAGVALAWGIAPLLLRIMPDSLRNIPFRDLTAIHLDTRVLGFTLGIALMTGILFGLAPALHAFGIGPGESLKEGGTRGSNLGSGRRVRSALVIAEVALALTVLASAGLMITSMRRLLAVGPGFNPKGVLMGELALPQTDFYGEPTRPLFCQQMEERISRIPGVISVSAASHLPLNGYAGRGVTVEGAPEPAPGQQNGSAYTVACPNYFRTMEIPLLEGREFTNQDALNAPGAAIINDSFRKRYFPNEDPIGRRFKAGHYKDSVPWKTVVGVVADMHFLGLDQGFRPQFFVPYSQAAWPEMAVVVRAESNPAMLSASVRKALTDVVPEQPLSETETMEEIVESSVGPRKFPMLLLSGFAIVALTLTAIGVYGVVSYAVAQRTHEIGIRMALGAQTGPIYRLIIRQAMFPVCAGVLLGVGGALALSRYLQNQLYSVRATNPFVIGGALLLLGIVAMLACVVPARRATRVDPLIALRYE
ncbi:MAG: ABC transporter permease [Candidatus Acidiferrales bacterium]